ncbi:hypothetical protein PIB30_079277 [Stylosanthes scabra]|uniref:Uncharacterized protein n=1 Tax=Stylosanthes scabra TaxID=79078 RepID=A0ABU6TRV3_9FABA|nr:hypothetical protein [Stylosanthes scabra]
MTAISRPIDVDADEDYLQYLEELHRNPEYSPIHSCQAFAQHPSDNAQSLSFDSHNHPNYDLFETVNCLVSKYFNGCLDILRGRDYP